MSATLHPTHATLVFIDASLPDMDSLLTDLPAGAPTHLLNPSLPLLPQMAQALASHRDVAALHLITHGAPGKLCLGTCETGLAALKAHADEVAAIAAAMAEDGEWLLYGCEVAAGRAGRAFIDALTNMTGLKVAAATHKVGHAALQGDWELDVMPAGMVAQALVVPAWHGVLMPDPAPTTALPSFGSLNGGNIDLVYDQLLFATPQGPYTVQVKNGTTTVSTISVMARSVTQLDGKTYVSLTLQTPLFKGQGDLTDAANYVMVQFQSFDSTYSSFTTTGPSYPLTLNQNDILAPRLNAFAGAVTSEDGTKIILTYNEALDAANKAPAESFTVMVDSTANPITAVTVSGSTVELTLTTPVVYGQTVTISHTDPDTNNFNNINDIQDTSGNDAALFTAKSVVNSTPTPPNVRSVDSYTPDGTYKVGGVIDIEVHFNEAVVVTGTPQLTLETGSTDRVASYTGYTSGAYPSNSSLTFRYTVQAGDSSADLDYTSTSALALNGGTIKNAANINAILVLPAPGGDGSLGNYKNFVIDAVVPAVSGVTSSTADGTYKVGDVISIQVNFNKTVTVTGTPQLTLETGSTDRVVDYTSGSGTNSLTFAYTVQAGDNSTDLDFTSTSALALNGGTIKDAANDNATLTLAAPGAANSLGNNKAIVIDGVVPTVSSVSVPADNTYGPGTHLDFTVNFSDNVTVDTTGGTPRIALTVGSATAYANYLSGTGTSALVFRYIPQVTDADSDGIAVGALGLNGGTLKDAAGNDATLTLNSVGSTTGVLVANTAPTLTTVSTLTGATEDTAFEITYAALAAAANEADVDTGSTLSFRVEAVSSGNLYTDSNLTASVTPGTTLLSTGGTWYWKPATDANGSGGSALDAFTVKAWDGAAASATAVQVKVDTTAVNDIPALTAGSLSAISVLEDSANTTATTLGLSAVTYGTGGGSDENGQTLTYTLTAIPTFVTLWKADGTTQVTATNTVTATELQGLKYKTVADGYGTGNLTWTVQDDGGTANSGVDTLNQSLALTLTGVADTPSVTNANTTPATQTTTGLVLSRNAADGAEVTHFKITGITNGNLFQNDGTTAISDGDFITIAQGTAGLKFTPTGGGNGSFTAQSSTSNADGGLGGSTANATIAVGAAVASPTVAEDANSSAIAITFGGSETFYKITSITGGTLYSDSGFTTLITDGSFIAQGSGGGNASTTNVYFQPAADRNTTTGGNGSFVVQASTSNADAGLTGSQLTSTVTLTPVADTPSVTNATAIANAQNTSGLLLSRNAADGAETTHFKITGITGGSLFKNDGTTAINDGDFITFAEGNAGLKFTPSGTTAGSFTAQASSSNADGGLAGSTVDATINVATPTITSAAYDATTHVLTVTGTNLPALAGVTNDISVTKLTLTGEDDATYQLTSNDVEITSSTSFAITLNATDQAGLSTILNKAGLTSTGGATYNLAVATGWAPGYATTPEDLTSNAVTVSAVPVPTITSATYDASTGALVLTGTGFLKLTGATNEIVANKFTFTGEGGETYTLTNTANVEITSGTAATIALSATDKAAVNQIVNKAGTSSTGGTTYNIAAAEDWAAGADATAVVADTTGNGITASNVPVPTITSATYDTGTGVLVVTGAGFLKKSGATNDIDISKLKFTGQGGAGAAYTLTSASDVEITSATSFTVTLSGADRTAVDALLNKTGTSANDTTVYVLGGLEDWAAGADVAVDVADEAGNAISVTVFVPPADPGPTTPPTTTTTTTIGGTTVQTTTTGSGGTTTTTQTVTPVTNTPNGSLADIPLATDSSGAPTVQISLPMGVGVTSEATTGSNLSLEQKLINASQPRVDNSADFSQILSLGIQAYVPTVGDESQVTVRTVTLTTPTGSNSTTTPAQPIVITGATGTGEADSAHPQRQEALVIDARNLPPGTVLDLRNVEFAIIIGPSRIIGGNGANVVMGDGSQQFIVLGPDDDIIRGGAGDDTVGSKGGNDQLFGDEGNDTVVGGIGNDTLHGGDGNDILQGGASDAGAWSFKLAPDGQLQASFVPTNTELADSAGFSVTGKWTHPSGAGMLTDNRFAWVYDDYAVAKDAALLVQALAGRLPTLAEMGTLADGSLSSQQLANAAHAYFTNISGTQNASTEAQLQAVIAQVWGSGAATNELIQVGKTYLSTGGNWADIWLALARHSTHASKLTDAQGNVSLISNQKLGETGWSGNSGADKLFGGAGNDVLVGGNGNDEIDGGTGTDMAVWFGAIADYQIALTPSTAQGAPAGAQDALIRHKVTGEADTVRNVELYKVGSTVYSVPAGQAQPADGVFVELASYVQPVTQDLVLLGFVPAQLV